MNIRDYYEKTAKACFFVAWISLVLAILFFICHMLRIFPKDMLDLIFPVIILSFTHFIYFRVYHKRVERLGDEPFETSGELFYTENILIAFMPAPTLRLLLFNHNGLLLGEIRDQNMRWFMWLVPNSLSLLFPKKYELINSKEEVVAKYMLKAGLTNSMKIYNTNDELIGRYKENWKDSLLKIKGIIFNKSGEWISVSSKASLYHLDLKTLDNIKVASLQEGWMPQEWTKRFELNTPIITFSSLADESERTIILGFFAAVLHHRDN